MKRFRGFISFIVLIAFVSSMLIITGCAKKEPKVYKVGAVLPLTGDIAEYGNRCKVGIDMALNEINSTGGIIGKQIQVIYEDSKGIPKEGVSSLRKLITVDKVPVVVGAVASSVTLAMVPIATEAKVVIFSPASSSPKLSGISNFFFRDWPSDVLEAKVLAEFAFNELKLRRIAILYVNNDYGIGLKDEFQKNFVKLGGEVVAIETHKQGERDFRKFLAKVAEGTPQAIYLAGYHREMAFATKQIQEMGIKSQILGDADYGIPELIDIAGKAAEGAIYSTPSYEPESGDKAMQAFYRKFKEVYNKTPTPFEVNGYDALKIIAKAIEVNGYVGPKIAEYITGLKNYPGASGTMSFETTGDVVKPINIKVVKDGQFIPYSKH